MVRIKRERRRKLYLLAAACVSCVAVLVLLIISLLFLIKSGSDKVYDAGLTEAVAEAPEAPGEKDVPFTPKTDKPENGKNGIPENSAPEKTDTSLSADSAPDMPGQIDDDSLQDENSLVNGDIPMKGEDEKVYITFDDGPSVFTNEILDILKEYNVKATFFVCGTGDNDESLRPVYKRIVDEGHTIGMHSYSHVYSRVYGDLDMFQYDLDKIRNLIYNETGVVPKYYRFPGGSGNTIASLPMEQYISVLYSQGMEYYDWNVYGGDSSGNRLSSENIIKNTLDGVDRRKTAVILLHDTGSRKNTVDALPGILEGLKERGADIRAIDDDTPPLHQYLDNN